MTGFSPIAPLRLAKKIISMTDREERRAHKLAHPESDFFTPYLSYFFFYFPSSG